MWRPFSEREIERFMSQIRKTDTCWLWTGHVDKRGYPRFNIPQRSNGKIRDALAYRVAWELFQNVELPDVTKVVQTCGQARCVCPSYLKLRPGKGSDVKKRFFSFVRKTKGCWIWKGALDTTGYGKFFLQGRLCGAHRVSLMLFTGEDIKGLAVLHRCDNPRCVRPSHLHTGTAKQNTADMLSKGRQWRKITDEQVLFARQWFHEGVTRAEIARRLNVSWTAIDALIAGETHGHVG